MPAVFLLRRHATALDLAAETLAAMDGWTLAGRSTQVRDASHQIARLRPEIVASDLHCDDGAALRLEGLLRQMPQRPLVLLLADSADDIGMFETLARIGNGYALEGGRSQGLTGALRRLASGRASMSPLLAQQALAHSKLGRTRLVDAQDTLAASDFAPTRPGADGLLRTEQHLLSLIAHGLLVGEIASNWGLSDVEIERRLYAVYQRLHSCELLQAA